MCEKRKSDVLGGTWLSNQKGVVMSLKYLVFMAVVAAGVCYADHGHISGPFVRGQAMYSYTIELSVAEPNFIANLGGSNADVYSELWTVAGAVSPDTGPGSGVAQVYHAYDEWYLNHLHLGDPSGGSGTIIYHFAATQGQSFTGGMVTVKAYYSGDTSQMWVSTSTVEPTGGGTAGTVGYWNTVTWSAYHTQMFNQYNTEADYVVNIPVGEEFWVAVSKPSGSSSVYAQIRSIEIEATLVQNCAALAADLDGDCAVDFRDFTIVAESWLACSDADDPQNCPGTAGPDGFPWESN